MRFTSMLCITAAGSSLVNPKSKTFRVRFAIKIVAIVQV